LRQVSADVWTFESDPPEVVVREFARLDEAVSWIAHRRLSGVLTERLADERQQIIGDQGRAQRRPTV
jgi:hypothetical protein